ncbi:hypothetical protein BDZ91DRAFT_165160 [Kalaharituber pfeilii]|nr:hypothetical protein BDZ91DRAFT_165160 [Kalaharituber pfeilii]
MSTFFFLALAIYTSASGGSGCTSLHSVPSTHYASLRSKVIWLLHLSCACGFATDLLSILQLIPDD